MLFQFFPAVAHLHPRVQITQSSVPWIFLPLPFVLQNEIPFPFFSSAYHNPIYL